jgi:hypothetical protein
MKFVEQIIALFGHSSDTKEMSDFLDKHNIHQRPQFAPNEGAPEETIGKEDDGYSLRFGGRLSFEENIGPSVGDRDLGYFVLENIRLQGPLNMDKASEFKGELPFGLSFSQTADEIIEILGKPDFAEDPGTRKRVFVWNNVQNLQLGTVLSPDEKHMRHLEISPTPKEYRS